MSKRDISTVSFASKRAQIIKKAKSDDKGKYVGTKLDTTEKEPVKDEVEFPKVVKRSHELDDQLEVGIYSRKRKGVSFSDPKIILKGDGKKRNVTLWLPPMKVKYASLGENGNLGRFTDDVNRARFTVQLESDVPEEMGEVRKSMEKAGDDAIDFIKKWSNQAMEIAFHDESTWTDKCKRYDDDQAFVKDAKHSVIKTDNEDIENISLTRRLEGWQGEPNRPYFWKLSEDNTYERIEPKYITSGSVLSVQMTFRAFNMPDRHGMAGDLGQHIIVVYMPKRNKPKTNPLNIPYIPFDE